MKKKIKLFIISNKWMFIGIIAVLTCFISVSSIYSATLLPSGRTADTLLHLDYSWQVYHKQLPNFWDGPQAPITNRIPSVQFVSQHPPLFYLLLAPFTGPQIDRGDWESAVKTARTINILFGATTVVALAWAGWVYSERRKGFMALSTAAVGASMLQFVKMSGDIFNDPLAITFTIIVLTLAGLIIKRGPKGHYIIFGCIASILGLSTRASALSAVLLLILSILISFYLHFKKYKYLKAALYVSALVLAIALSIGWFYWHNYKLSGDWFRSAPQSWITDYSGRKYKSLSEVVTSKRLWFMIRDRLYGSSHIKESTRILISSSLFILSSFGVLIGFKKSVKKYHLSKRGAYKFLLPGLLIAQFAMVYIEQVIHATGYGAYSFRYILPALLPLSLFISYGLSQISKRGTAVVIYSSIGFLMVLANSIFYIDKRTHFLGSSNFSKLDSAFSSYTTGGTILLTMLLVLVMAGIYIQLLSLFKLSKAFQDNL